MSNNFKKYIFSILIMIFLISIFTIVNADQFTDLSEFKAYVLHSGNMALTVHKDSKDYKRELESLKTYLNAATKNKNGNYEIVCNSVDGKTEKLGYLSEADWKAAIAWVEDGCQDDSENNSTEEVQKNQIYNDVNSMIGVIYNASVKDNQIDYSTYIEKLKEQLESIRNDGQYTGSFQEYRISLYEKEIKSAEALESVEEEVSKESKGMTLEEINEKLKILNSNLQRYENMSSNYVENGKSRDQLIEETKAKIKLYEQKKSTKVLNNNIYKYPARETNSTIGSLDDMIGDADSFISKANDKDDVISSESLQSFSQIFYNILLTVGIIVAVLVGLVIGIRFMIGGAEERANIKEILLPYIAGCVIVFGAFAIWKIVVIVLSEV